MINLNSSEYDNDFQLTTEKILNLVSDYQIFKFYEPSMVVGKSIPSPLAKDIDPSFSVFYSERHNKLMYKDFRNESGDCFIFVKNLFSISYYQALCKICQDFSLDLPYKKLEGFKKLRREIPENIKYEKITSLFNIGINAKEFSKSELDWWGEYNISKELLDFYNVKSCKRLFLNNRIIECDQPTYCFTEFKDEKFSSKIYQPFSKEYKWLTNHNFSVIQGFCQIPNKGNLLIISKSLKDCITLRSIGYYAISPQSESSFVKDVVLQQLKERFTNIIIWLDNDSAGRKMSKKFSEQSGLPEFYIPIGKPKDPSDYLKKYGKEKLKSLIEKSIEFQINK